MRLGRQSLRGHRRPCRTVLLNALFVFIERRVLHIKPVHIHQTRSVITIRFIRKIRFSSSEQGIRIFATCTSCIRVVTDSVSYVKRRSYISYDCVGQYRLYPGPSSCAGRTGPLVCTCSLGSRNILARLHAWVSVGIGTFNRSGSSCYHIHSSQGRLGPAHIGKVL